MTSKTFEVFRQDLPTVFSKHYVIDYYQREYKWEKSQMTDLLNDLYKSFSLEYDRLNSENRLPKDNFYCDNFKQYFLGSIVINNEDNKYYKIVDGQQRLISLSLLFMVLTKRLDGIKNRSKDEREIQRLQGFIKNLKELYKSSFHGGEITWNISTPNTVEVFDQIEKEENLDKSDNNLISNYLETEKYFSDKFDDIKELYFFCRWLLNRVLIININTYSGTEAFTIFETMNDRGLPLENYEILKGLILSSIEDSEEKTDYTIKWESIIEKASSVNTKETQESVDRFFTGVLQGHYGKWELSNELLNVSSPEWNQIHNIYHRWVKENYSLMGLENSEDFKQFIDKLEIFADWYIKFCNPESFGKDSELYLLSKFGAKNSHTKRIHALLPVFFAVIDPFDTKESNIERLRIVCKLYETMYAYSIWSGKPLNISKGISKDWVALFQSRDKDKILLMSYLYLTKIKNSFDKNAPPSYKSSNNKELTYLLMRIHDLFETSVGKASLFSADEKYSIEHIIADTEENYEYFNSEDDFEMYRNQIGALLVLPQSINSSYRNQPIAKKVKRYPNNTVFASILADSTYDKFGKLRNNPKLSKLQEDLKEKFKSFSKMGNRFGIEEIRSRNTLYSKILKKVYDPIWFIEQSGLSFKELSEFYFEDEHYTSGFFDRDLMFYSNDTQAELGMIHQLYSKDGGKVRIVAKNSNERLDERIYLNSGGVFEYNETIVPYPSTLTGELGFGRKSGWQILHVVYNDNGKDVEKSLSEIREELKLRD